MAIGSISFLQEPQATSNQVPVITNWNPIIPYTVYQDDISGLYYFKLILEVRLDSVSGTVIAKLKQRRNGYPADISADEARATFDLRDIVNSQLEDTIADQNDTTKSIHTLGSNVVAKPFSLNNNQVKTISVIAYQEYSELVSATPSEESSPAVNDTRKYIAASLLLEIPRGTADFQNTAFQAFQLDDASGRFLSDIQQSSVDVLSTSVYRNYVQDTDYHTLGFLNGKATNPATTQEFDSELRYFYVQYYESDGTEINSGVTKRLSNAAAYGGCKPLESDGEIDADNERLVYVGCGPANLEAQTYDADAKPSNNSGWAYYKVYANDGGGNDKSADYYFIKQDGSCKGFKVRRLAWRNSLGCYDYFNFKMKSTQSIDVTKNDYETVLGNFNSNMYSYDNFGRGKKTRQTTALVKETLNTDWITEQDAQLLEGLIMSTNVEVIENADTTYTVPVMVTDKSFVRKTVANDKIKIQYTINIEYANPLNTNS
tara:strand:+ start:363 stop:1823 length:1461 start_codon:yes stop_codon:yes gene_type:complete